VNVSGVITSDTVRGTVTLTSASTVASATLQGALVRASLVKADAHASKTGSVLAFTATGSSFGSPVGNRLPVDQRRRRGEHPIEDRRRRNPRACDAADWGSEQ
jgi:hypothetical protein